jgi:nitrogen fixation protein FixH
VTAATIVVGSRSFDGLVVEKPYENGLDWDKAEQQKTRLGWQVSLDNASVRVGATDLKISIFDKPGTRLKNADVTVKLTRPETTAFDHGYKAVPQPDGSYRASVTVPVQGNWQAVVAVAQGKNRVVYTLPVYVSGGSHDNAGHH